MKTCRKLFFILFSLLTLPTAAFPWTGQVVNVSDGDTITVRRENGPQVKVRLYGIDCPEKAQPYGEKARELTASMVAGRNVDVHEKDVDRYGRTVGLVSVDGAGLNESIVRNGFAWVYPQYCKESFCLDWSRMELSAKRQGRGMWADPHIVPPWDWRHGGKQVAAAEPENDGNGQLAKHDSTSGAFHGNVNSHKLHRPGCQHYNCKNCTATFGSKSEAIAAGYSPCGTCQP